jgi:hypothetical protein
MILLINKKKLLLILVLGFFVCNITFANNKFSLRNSHIKNWYISCDADDGAIKKKGNSFYFSESKNNCGKPSKHKWQQRSEIASGAESNFKGKISFKYTLSLISSSKEKFTFFQIHDGRESCAPPLKIDWTEMNSIRLESHYKIIGKGEEYCVPNWNMRNAKALYPIVLRRDGTKYDVELLLDFDGEGNFTVEIFVDDELALVSAYQRDATFASVKTEGGLTVINPVFEKFDKLYFKQGSYSFRFFNYDLNFENMKIKFKKK